MRGEVGIYSSVLFDNLTKDNSAFVFTLKNSGISLLADHFIVKENKILTCLFYADVLYGIGCMELDDLLLFAPMPPVFDVTKSACSADTFSDSSIVRFRKELLAEIQRVRKLAAVNLKLRPSVDESGCLQQTSSQSCSDTMCTSGIVVDNDSLAINSVKKGGDEAERSCPKYDCYKHISHIGELDMSGSFSNNHGELINRLPYWVSTLYETESTTTYQNHGSDVSTVFVDFETSRKRCSQKNISSGLSLIFSDAEFSFYDLTLINLSDRLVNIINSDYPNEVKVSTLQLLLNMIDFVKSDELNQLLGFKLRQCIPGVFKNNELYQQSSTVFYKFLSQQLRVNIFLDEHFTSWEIIDALFHRLLTEKSIEKQEVLILTIAKSVRQSKAIASSISNKFKTYLKDMLANVMKKRSSPSDVMTPFQHIGLVMIFSEIVTSALACNDNDAITGVFKHQLLSKYLKLFTYPIKNPALSEQHLFQSDLVDALRIHYYFLLHNNMRLLIALPRTSMNRGFIAKCLTSISKVTLNYTQVMPSNHMSMASITEENVYCYLYQSFSCLSSEFKPRVSNNFVKKSERETYVGTPALVDNNGTMSDATMSEIRFELRSFLLEVERGTHSSLVSLTNSIPKRKSHNKACRLSDVSTVKLFDAHKRLVHGVRGDVNSSATADDSILSFLKKPLHRWDHKTINKALNSAKSKVSTFYNDDAFTTHSHSGVLDSQRRKELDKLDKSIKLIDNLFSSP